VYLHDSQGVLVDRWNYSIVPIHKYFQSTTFLFTSIHLFVTKMYTPSKLRVNARGLEDDRMIWGSEMLRMLRPVS